MLKSNAKPQNTYIKVPANIAVLENMSGFALEAILGSA